MTLTFCMLFLDMQAQMCTTLQEWQSTCVLTRIKQGSKTMAGWSNWCCLKIQRPLLNGATHISMNPLDWLFQATCRDFQGKDSQLRWQVRRDKTPLKTPLLRADAHTDVYAVTCQVTNICPRSKLTGNSRNIKCQWCNFRPFLLIVLGNGLRAGGDHSHIGAQTWFFLSGLIFNINMMPSHLCLIKKEHSFSLASSGITPWLPFAPKCDMLSIASSGEHPIMYSRVPARVQLHPSR